MIRYEVRLADAYGSPLDVLDSSTFYRLEYALSVGGVGALTLTLPARYPTRNLRLDGRISVWRRIHGRAAQLDGDATFLIRRWLYTEQTTTVSALHANHLLKRRIIAYQKGSSYTVKAAAAAGNQIKVLARENMGASIVGVDRKGSETQADISAYCAIAANLGDGASVVVGDVAWRNLYEVISELAQASTLAGTYLTFEVVTPAEGALELRTFAGQRGIDHRSSSSTPVIFSPQRRNLQNARLTVDRADEVSWGVAMGTGERDNRISASALDLPRMGESPLNRLEGFEDYSNVSKVTQLASNANALVRQGRPRTWLEGDIIDTDATTRGIHYDYGDLVTAEFRGQQFDYGIDVVAVTVEEGRVSQTIQLRSLT